GRPTGSELGYEYIAFTGHSPSQRIARGLDLDRPERKIEEIERLRKKRKDLRRRHQVLRRKAAILYRLNIGCWSIGSSSRPVLRPPGTRARVRVYRTAASSRRAGS